MFAFEGENMTDMDIGARLDALSEVVVLADADDPGGLAALHSGLDEIAAMAGAASDGVTRDAAAASARLVERIILNEIGDADEALEIVCETVTIIQSVYRDGQSIASVSFPAALGLSPGPPTGEPEAVNEHHFLPANVDEEIFSDFLERQPGVLHEMERLVLEFENSPDARTLRALFRLMHTLKGEAGLLGLVDVERTCHVAEDLLSEEVTSLPVDAFLDLERWLGQTFNAYTGKDEFPPPPESIVQAFQEAIEGGDSEDSPCGPEAEGAAEEGQVTPEVMEFESGPEDKTTLDEALEFLIDTISVSSPADKVTLANLHGQFEDIRDLANGVGLAEIQELAGTAVETISRVILEEDSSPVRSLCELREIAHRLRTTLSGVGFEDPAAQSDSRGDRDAEGQRESARQTRDEETPWTGDRRLVDEFIRDAANRLELVDVHLLTLETETDDVDVMNAVYEIFHSVGGAARVLNLEDIHHLTESAEKVLDLARKGQLFLGEGVLDAIFDAFELVKELIEAVETASEEGAAPRPSAKLPKLIGRLRRLVADPGVDDGESVALREPGSQRLGEILVEAGAVTEECVETALHDQDVSDERPKLGDVLIDSGAVTPEAVEEALDSQRIQGALEKQKLGEILVEQGDVTPREVDAGLKQQANEGPPKLGELLVRSGSASPREVVHALRTQKLRGMGAIRVKDSLKVDVARLDQLVETIGELVIAGAMVSESEEMRSFASPELTRSVGQLDKITRELQEMGTNMRLVPIRPVFQKMARLSRDLAKKSGKQVTFSMSGVETEVDKHLVDKIGDPLVHLVRNAMDHGLEDTPAEREKAGKSSHGRIELRAFHRGSTIYIEVEDDGRGLNRELIWAKAVERGLVKEDQVLSDHDLWQFIFEPGFTTAEVVTDVSGRGVGMDVVRRTVDELRGSIEVTSEEGKGSLISIRLPLTLAIIEGMVLRVGTQRYIVPTLSVTRLLRPDEQEFFSVFERDEMLRVQGSLLAVHRLHDLFGIQDDPSAAEDGVAVVIENDGTQTALVVDEVLGQQQTVIKPLGDGVGELEGIAGAAIMPDGKVGLILDVCGIFKLAREKCAV